MNPNTFEIIDYVGGQKDLKKLSNQLVPESTLMKTI